MREKEGQHIKGTTHKYNTSGALAEPTAVHCLLAKKIFRGPRQLARCSAPGAAPAKRAASGPLLPPHPSRGGRRLRALRSHSSIIKPRVCSPSLALRPQQRPRLALLQGRSTPACGRRAPGRRRAAPASGEREGVEGGEVHGQQQHVVIIQGRAGRGRGAQRRHAAAAAQQAACVAPALLLQPVAAADLRGGGRGGRGGVGAARGRAGEGRRGVLPEPRAAPGGQRAAGPAGAARGTGSPAGPGPSAAGPAAPAALPPARTPCCCSAAAPQAAAAPVVAAAQPPPHAAAAPPAAAAPRRGCSPRCCTPRRRCTTPRRRPRPPC